METLAEMARKEMGAQPAQSPFTPWLLTTLISSETRPLGAVPVSAIALACTRVRSTSNGKTTAQVKSAAEAPAVAVWRAVRLSGIISRNVP